MLNKLLQSREFKGIVDETLKHTGVVDIFLFGSAVKGKEQPHDIDVLLLFSRSVDKEYAYSFRKRCELKGFPVHVSALRYEEILQPSFLAREGILTNGYSFRAKDFLSSALGFSSFVLFRYSLKGKNDSERVRFYYALYGRKKSKGVLDSFASYKFGGNLLLVPATQAEHLKLFFEAQGLPFEEIPILLPKRLAKKEFLEGQ